MKKGFVYSSAAAVALLAGSAALPASAQQVQRPAAQATALEEIVVTARRQEEAAQSTPVSVSAFSEAALDNFNVRSVEKLGAYVPNLTISPTTSYLGAAVAFIRGIGAQEPQMAVDSPVGIYLDGVYIGRNTAANFDLVQVERIEVLRGPQGSLFGRNTTGGAVSMTTKRPTQDFNIEEKVGYGSFDEWYSRTTINTGELGNTGLTATLAYMHRQIDGYVDNPYATDAHDPGARRSDSFWGKVHGEWGALTADYMFDFDNTRGQSPAPQVRFMRPDVAALFANSPNLGGQAFPVSTQRQDTLALIPYPDTRFQIWGHALTLQYDINDALSVKSISAVRRYWSTMASGYTPPGLLGRTGAGAIVPIALSEVAHRDAAQSQISEEFQLLGKTDRFSYVGGLYYFHETAFEYTPTTFTLPVAGSAFNSTSVTRYSTNNDSYALFGNVGYTPPILDDKLEASVGARYTIDKKRVDQQFAVARVGDRKFHNFSFTTSLNYKVTDDLMAYTRVGTGYRSGGFNIRAGAGVAFEYPPEKAWAYEVGLKSEWFDRRLRLNGALFWTDYKNLQVSQFTGATVSGNSGSTKSAKATYKGAELEMQAIPFPGLTLDGSIGLVIPTYKSIYFPNPANTAELVNYAKASHFPYVSRWTNHFGAQYAFEPTPIGQITVRGDYVYQSQRWWHTINLPNVNPFNDQIKDEGEQLVSARVTLSQIPMLGGDNVEISVWGENLLNETYFTSGIEFGALGYAEDTYGKPRSFGVDVKVKF
jgi:iron complex outermembrane receptor protein